MVETVKSTYDFIKGAVPIRVGILANEDAESVCMKNNLSFAELVKPFSILTNEAQIQGPSSQTYHVYNLHVHATDIKSGCVESNFSSHENIAAQVLDLCNADKVPMVTVHAGDYSLNVNRTCPWMEIYRNFVLKSGPPESHEFLSHLVACMLVVSSSNPDPIKAFSDISQQQNRIQHGDTSRDQFKWMTPNTMKYYVLLHDVKDGDITKAKEVFSSLQSMFGLSYVYLLQINSRESSIGDSDADVPVPWRQMKNLSIMEPTSISRNCNGAQTSPSSSKMLGRFLDIEDHSALRNFMQEFILRALLPHLEKTIRNINDQLSTRKGLHKSIFKATKAIFGSSKNSSFSSGGGYHSDSNELLVRKAADLCFLSQMYDQALHLYHGAKKDYMNDQAWIHAAGASEMAAVSNFMMRSAKQSYPIQYMEYAINLYLDVCRRDQLALRCSLIHVECLQQVGFFQEAAFHLVRMTDENDDLRSALLLEQAAYCYLKMQNPQPKKFAFQLVLAGHRFGKCGQKAHAVRCYEMTAQMYSGKIWRLIHDHLDFAVGRMYSSAKDYPNALDYFRKLLIRESSLLDVQQIFVLREFGNVWHKCMPLDGAENYANLCLPKLTLEETLVTIGKNDGVRSADFTHSLNSEIRRVEEQFLDQKKLARAQLVGAITNLSKHTSNVTGHQISVGESAEIEISCTNHLGIPIVLYDVSLQFSFENSKKATIENGPPYNCRQIEYTYMTANSKSSLMFRFEPLVTGQFLAKAMSYRLGCHLAGERSGDDSDRTLQVIDSQPLVIRGKRLNGTRQEKFGVFYASDSRLNIQSFVGIPEINATVQDFPDSLLCNEVKDATLVVWNTGKFPISGIEFAASSPVLITPKGRNSNKQSDMVTFYTLSSDILAPGQTGKYDLSLEGPLTPGQYTSNIMLFCKSVEPSVPKYRSFILCHELSCTESVNLEIEMINAKSETDCVIAACVEGVGQNAEDFLFKEISLTPTEATIESIGNVDSSAVPVATKLYKYFKHERRDVGNISMNNQNPEAFVKWTYRNESHEKLVSAQKTVTVKCADPISVDDDNNNLVSAETLKYLHHTVSWRLSTSRTHYHDFSIKRFCVIDCELTAVNTSKYKLSVSINATMPPASPNHNLGFSWVGLSKVNQIIEPSCKSTVVMKACFTKSGIYSFGGTIVVSAIPVDLSTEVPIPQKPLSSYFVTISDLKSGTE